MHGARTNDHEIYDVHIKKNIPVIKRENREKAREAPLRVMEGTRWQLPGDTRNERYSPGAKERGLRCFLRTAGRPAPALEGMKSRLTPIPSLPVLSQAPVETVVPNGSPSREGGEERDRYILRGMPKNLKSFQEDTGTRW
jgi:hypothetical protein